MSEQVRKTGSRERVRVFLEQHGVADGLFEFEQSTKTAAQAAEVMGCELGQIVKSLVVSVDGSAVLALVAGDRRGDLDAIASALGGEKARMGDADLARAATGYAIGGVCPFDLPPELPVLVDESLQRFSTVYPAAGTPSSMVRVNLARLIELSAGRFAPVGH